ERGKASAELAARRLAAAAAALFLKSLDRNEDLSVLDRRCARDGRGGILVDFALPDLLSRYRVDGVGIGPLVAEEHGVTRLSRASVWPDRERASDAELRFVRPVNATGFGINRIQLRVVARDKQL